MKKQNLIVITGPTASGKSALAVSLAQKLNTEIISADSRQIFKGIPIVTAVPTEEEKGGIKHHLLEVLSLDAYYSAARFREDSINIIREIFLEKENVIVCGGSMLYIDALTNGIDDLPTVPDNIRDNLAALWKSNGDEWLLRQLKELDPVYYENADLKNLKRIFHAVEISITAGRPYSSLLTGRISFPEALPFNIIKFCLSGPRELLFEKINSRVVKMMEKGLEEEALRVYDLRNLNSLNTVGLKEMFSMIDGILSREEAVARIQKNTRVYAKKQLTWHKRDKTINYLNFCDSPEENINNILEYLS
ncbi:MAG: tRNA (adenosine(37)-N6)-dimethylallyltransferase MiaA [Muribaculaceae bacterium]|nr:tRNA (adenosine(37)-N6)-dimethylallyltransferase MiaA [Muribaculaceae bacterium]